MDKIIFVPTGISPHKNRKISSVTHRYNMLSLALSSKSYFMLSDVELKKSGKSFTFDTLQLLKKKFELRAEIFFIVGADSILRIKTWKKYNQLLDLCQFIVVMRPGYDLSKLDKKTAKKVLIAKIKGLAISATEIRLRVKEAIAITYLVPPKVEEYIYKHKLYK